jgi:hypothetical protein
MDGQKTGGLTDQELIVHAIRDCDGVSGSP